MSMSGVDYAGDTYERSRSGLIIPDRLKTAAEHGEDITTCPAATLCHKDGEPAIRCGVAGDTFLIRHSPAAAGLWCCGEPGEYSKAEVGCPVWRASRHNPDRVDRQHAVTERRRTDRLTMQQIERGVRVDDRFERHVEAEAEKLAAGSAIFADPGQDA